VMLDFESVCDMYSLWSNLIGAEVVHAMRELDVECASIKSVPR
jgi:hypothetical protein